MKDVIYMYALSILRPFLPRICRLKRSDSVYVYYYTLVLNQTLQEQCSTLNSESPF